MNVLSRTQWGARYGIGKAQPPGPVDLVVFHHFYRPDVECGEARATERKTLQSVEKFHATDPDRRWSGIAYSFVIFQTGRIYEGRGWGRIGSHTGGRNSTSVGIAFAVNGTDHELTPAAIEAAQWLIQEGIHLNHIDPGYRVGGHRDFQDRTCPGDLVYAQLGSFGPLWSVQDPTPPTIRKGHRGEKVKIAQRALGIPDDGIFGPGTEQAVRDFQEAHGLLPDGIVGPKTWDELT